MGVLGLGRKSLRALPVDADFRMDLSVLGSAIESDRKEGLTPFCVIATAGTVNTGSFDDLRAIAAICRANGLWLHVDGAFGASAILSPKVAPLLAGIECADSIAFDFHKWLHVPYDAGCLLVRDASLQRQVFGGRPNYLASVGGLSGGDPWPCDLGIELSRGFRALKIWFTIKEHGTERLGSAIARNCAQAERLASRLRSHSVLRLMAPVSLNIVCCRYHIAGIGDDVLDAVNSEIVVAIQEAGVAAPSTCRINGRLCIRICITNHRSRDADLDVLMDALESLGEQLSAKYINQGRPDREARRDS